MADKTRIEWTDATWNPVTGCTKVSAGCKHCYAERDWARLTANPKTRYYGRSFTDVRCHSDVLELPLRWTRPRRIFVNSMSDLFHPDVPYRFVADVFGVMAACPQHSFQILTKRPDRMHTFLASGCMASFKDDIAEAAALYTDVEPVLPLPNVWLGVSVENQTTADERIPLLVRTPAAVRWISVEPFIGRIACLPTFLGLTKDGSRWARRTDLHAVEPRIHWVVVGGESGLMARPMHPDWARDLRDQCAVAGVPFMFKRWGRWVPGGYERAGMITMFPDGRQYDGWADAPSGYRMHPLGNNDAGSRLLDGCPHESYPR